MNPLPHADTIAAIATAPGAGGIGIIRISGPQSHDVLSQVFRPSSPRFVCFEPWKLHRGRVVDARNRILDDCLAVFMPGPHTFTGEDVAELHCHGGSALLQAVLEELFRMVRPAERGEFSRRAFLNGRMDLSQAEAIAELIAAPSREGVFLAADKLGGVLGLRVTELRNALETLRAYICLAVDFPDDEVESIDRAAFVKGVREVEARVRALLSGVERTRCWREGIVVALSGAVNAGKSSLMNALLGRERAIVTSTPGTTRDFLEEHLRLQGLPIRLVDTAGLRSTSDAIESAGIRMGLKRVQEADVVLLLVDGERGLSEETLELARNVEQGRLLLVWNKKDIALPPEDFCSAEPAWKGIASAGRLVLSARTGEGLEELETAIRSLALQGKMEPAPEEVAPNDRQAMALEKTAHALNALAVDVESDLPYELCAVRLEEAAHCLGEVVGIDTSDDVLNRIFSTFCIGK